MRRALLHWQAEAETGCAHDAYLDFAGEEVLRPSKPFWTLNFAKFCQKSIDSRESYDNLSFLFICFSLFFLVFAWFWFDVSTM